MSKVDFTPRYADLKFNSQLEFDRWLEETAVQKIELVDDGQDLTTFWVAKNKEIIHAEFGMAATLYNGAFVANEPEELGMLQVYNPKFEPEPIFIRWQIDTITNFKL